MYYFAGCVTQYLLEVGVALYSHEKYYFVAAYQAGLTVGILFLMAPLSMGSLSRQVPIALSLLLLLCSAAAVTVAFQLCEAHRHGTHCVLQSNAAVSALFGALGFGNWVLPLSLASAFDASSSPLQQAVAVTLLLPAGMLLPSVLVANPSQAGFSMFASAGLIGALAVAAAVYLALTPETFERGQGRNGSHSEDTADNYEDETELEELPAFVIAAGDLDGAAEPESAELEAAIELNDIDAAWRDDDNGKAFGTGGTAPQDEAKSLAREMPLSRRLALLMVASTEPRLWLYGVALLFLGELWLDTAVGASFNHAAYYSANGLTLALSLWVLLGAGGGDGMSVCSGTAVHSSWILHESAMDLTAVLAIVFAAVGYVAQLIATFAQIGVLFALLMCTPLLFIAITATVTLMANSCRRSLGALTTGVAFVLLRGGRSSWDIGGTLWLFFMAIAPNHTTGNYDGLAAILLWLLALVVFPALLLVPGVLISVTGLITLFAADQPRSNDVATPLW
eukprot:CAMPEP_0114613910 /NCGR_PEP_ID=MMETSP0168-20121206/5378_1 /TAXON_ID=95228 ORGANISM="Vannella sp., Strain DIVA3 517/6/12" /NCGR_SAMPLE_ID=MMETSP0168 /ASSEMBLY_ACC=CAM_ASM_000044 /LENGTH=507 /DNA_ID=CAMNT_0001824935 /DNA_START=1 /DNA_END=1522 /DNA_ORIENTATION=-